MNWFLNTANFNAFSLFTCCFRFRFLLNILLNSRRFYVNKCSECKLCVFTACLAWHWPDHHWQRNRRVAWTSSRTHAGKRRTLRATIVTIFSHMTIEISVFVKCDTIFRLCFFRTSNFPKVVRQHTEGMVGSIKQFCRKFSSLSSSGRILKIR